MNKDTKIKETEVKSKVIDSSGDSSDSSNSIDDINDIDGTNNYSYEEEIDSINDEDNSYHFLKPSAEEIEEENEIADILSDIDAQCRYLLNRRN